MNRGEMRLEIQRMLGDPSGIFLPDEEANAVMDEAMELMGEHGPPVIRKALIPLEAYKTFYRLTDYMADALQPLRLWSARLQAPLEPISMEELDARAVNWIRTVGPPTAWFPRGWDQFGIYPKPSVDGGILAVDCQCWPQAMWDDTSIPEFDEEDHETIVAYGWYDGSLRGNLTEDVVTAWKAFQNLLKGGYERRTTLAGDRGFRFQGGRNGSR